MKTNFIFLASNCASLKVTSDGSASHLTFLTDTIKASSFMQKEALSEEHEELIAHINNLASAPIEQFYSSYAIRVLINASFGIAVAIKGKSESEERIKRKYLLQ